MALQTTFETKSGITVTNAYFKVVDQGGNKQNINFRIRPFVSKEKADANIPIEGEEEIISFVPSVADDSKNIFAQCYDNAKTLDRYKDATDC